MRPLARGGDYDGMDAAADSNPAWESTALSGGWEPTSRSRPWFWPARTGEPSWSARPTRLDALRHGLCSDYSSSWRCRLPRRSEHLGFAQAAQRALMQVPPEALAITAADRLRLEDDPESTGPGQVVDPSIAGGQVSPSFHWGARL